MSGIIFAQPRQEYGSYQDLWQLIHLSGFPMVYYDEIDVGSDNTYILTIRNGDIVNGFPVSRARLVLWDLEYRRETQPPIPGIAEVWHMDKPQAELIGAKYVPIGGHPGLQPKYHNIAVEPYTLDNPYRYDGAFLAYMTYRRQHIYNQLQDRGVRLTPTSAWGDQRDVLLCSSKAYLHVHQHDDIPAVPGLRMVVAAAYSLPVISEDCADVGVFAHILSRAPYDFMPDMLQNLFGNPGSRWYASLVETGAMLHQFLCEELTFRRSVESAL